MKVRSTGHGLRQAFAELFLQETNNLAHALHREAFAAQLADDRDFSQVFERIHTAMSLACRNYKAALVPPLQLPSGDSGEPDYILRCERYLHLSCRMF